MSRDELLVVVRRQAERIAAQDRQISGDGRAARGADGGQRGPGREAGPAGASAVAELGELLESAVEGRRPGQAARRRRSKRGRGGPKRTRGKQPGAPGSHLAWTDDPDERRDRFPQGRCELRRGPGRRPGSGSGRPLPAARDPAGGGADHPVRPAPGGVRLRADPHRRPARRRPVRAGRVRPEPGRVRGLPDGRALHPRAPGGGAAGVADRGRPLGRVRARPARPHRRPARPRCTSGSAP